MKKSIPFLFAFAALVTGFLFFGDETSSHREKYEQFILKQSSGFAENLSVQNEETASPDQPDMAAYQEFIKTLDPALGYVPVKRLWKAYEYTTALLNRQKTSREYEPSIQWEGTGANMGGRTRTIMFDPNDSTHNKVWAGGVTGGLWFTNDITNLDSTWIPIGDFWSNLAVSCMAYDPNNTQTFYVGTGEAQTARVIYRKSSGLGAGIFKTTDGGASWELLDSTAKFEYITGIAVRDEDGTSAVYACVASGTYQGADHESLPSDGVYRSTDGGQTWQQVLPDIPDTDSPYTPADIEIAANGRIFVGTMENLDGLGGATVLFSDSGLPGSWTVYSHYNDVISGESLYNIPARTIVAVAPSDPNRVYAQFAAGYVDGFTYYRGRYIAQSQDGGATWTPVPKPDDAWSTLAWHAFILQVDPTDPDVIFTGGLDLWKSETAGAVWRRVSDWSLMYWGGGDEYVHADQHDIRYKPGSPSTAIFCSDGGVFLTLTADQTNPVFIERNQGYNTLQYYSCAIHPLAGAGYALGGLQDNGTLKFHGPPLDINDMIHGGDGAFCFWDENEPLIYISSHYYNRYRVWSNGESVYFEDNPSGNFISPADYDYSNNILYSNAVGAFGSSKNKLYRLTGIPSNPFSQILSIGTDSDVPFSTVSYSPFSPEGTSTLFVGTEAGKLYKVTNAESFPESVEIGSPDFPTAFLSCVAVGESEDNLLVTFSNYGVSSVWLTTDGGDTWVEKESNLPDMPVRWAIFHPENNGQVLLATETGVWATNTLNEDETEWAPATEGMANVRVDMLRLRKADNTVLAATHGRGLFTAEYLADIYVGQQELAEVATDLKIYPNPASDRIFVSFNLGKPQSFTLSLTDLNGRLVFNETNGSQQGRLTKEISLQGLSKGVYVLTARFGNRVESRKIAVE